MIGVSSSSRSFKALGRYLVVGRDEAQYDRVAWSTARNLPTDEPQLAAKIMRATAAQNVRVQQPVYHLALSFDPRDVVDRQQMERVADRVLSELGLREHQALIVAHRDRKHSHLHILVNRIHPSSRKAWDRWQDYTVVQRVLREEERALGLHELNAASRRGRALQEMTREQDVLAPPPRRAAYFEQRRALTQIRDDLGTLEATTEASRTRYSAELNLASSEARVAQLEETIRRVQRLEEAFFKALGAVYRDGEAARTQFSVLVNERGTETALGRLRDAPEMLGALREEFAAPRKIPSDTIEGLEVAFSRGGELVAARRELMAVLEREAGVRIVGIDQPVIDTTRSAVLARLAGAREEVRALRSAHPAAQTLAQLEFRLSQGIRRLAPPEFAKLCLTLSGAQLSFAHKLRGVARDVMLGREEGR